MMISIRRKYLSLSVVILSLSAQLSISGHAQCITTNNTPGWVYPLFDWQLIGGSFPKTFVYQMTEDVISFTVEEGTNLNLSPAEMQVNFSSNVSSGKRIYAWNFFRGTVNSLATANFDLGPKGMRITKGNCMSGVHTLVFGKAKFLSFPDMYHLDPTNFWRILGGKIVTIRWISDSGVSNSYPMPCSKPCVPVGRPAATPYDFDGDRRADITVYRPNEGNWYRINSATGAISVEQFGLFTDFPIAADYDGDGNADVAVWRPSTTTWWIKRSFTGQVNTVIWGIAGDYPLPADYNGDGLADYAVFHIAGAQWNIFPSNFPFFLPVTEIVGGAFDITVPADYDGDGRTDEAIWRQDTHQWEILNSTNRLKTFTFWGEDYDLPVPGDYDGDRRADLAVWRPSSGEWYIIKSNDGHVAQTQWGAPGDIPVPADYDGDGKTDLAVWRPSNGIWWIINSSDGSIRTQQWGRISDKPVLKYPLPL